jgi:hypothetical protein
VGVAAHWERRRQGSGQKDRAIGGGHMKSLLEFLADIAPLFAMGAAVILLAVLL